MVLTSCFSKLSSGPKKISYDAVIPIIIIPCLLFFAAQGSLYTLLIFSLTPIFIYYLNHNFLRFLIRTKFFFIWSITSVFLLILIFEICVVPLLEILPEENLVLVLCVIGAIICAYKTRQKSDKPNQENNLLDGLELGERSGDVCSTCRRRIPPRAYHCRICQTCILGREYHCKWLDCCIGYRNVRWYIGFLFFSSIAFMYGSNLIMTTICHPFLLVGTILIPDDCSDVYYQLDIGISFVSSVYCLIIGLILILYFFYHIWILYIGATTDERLHTNSENSNNILKYTSQVFCCESSNFNASDKT